MFRSWTDRRAGHAYTRCYRLDGNDTRSQPNRFHDANCCVRDCVSDRGPDASADRRGIRAAHSRAHA